MIPLGYHAMRMRWCRAALAAFLRRWAVYLVTGAAVFAAGTPGGVSGSVTAVQGACAWLVLPLFQAAGEPRRLALAIVLHAGIGAALVWGMRPLLWPARWAAAERALPIARRATLRSDWRVVPNGLVPWMLPCALGAHALLARDPAWLQPVRGRALFALAAAFAGSIGLGVALLQWLRRAPGHRHMPAAARRACSRRSTVALVATGWRRVLLWWPLWRGPARRSGRALIAGALALCAPAFALWRWPAAAGWWLAAYALGAFVVVTRLNGLARLELQALQQACLPLPLAPRSVQRGRATLALAPLLLSAILLLAACASLVALRPWVLAAYALAVAASCAVEVHAAPADAGTKASRWLFCVALMLALGSEVAA